MRTRQKFTKRGSSEVLFLKKEIKLLPGELFEILLSPGVNPPPSSSRIPSSFSHFLSIYVVLAVFEDHTEVSPNVLVPPKFKVV